VEELERLLVFLREMSGRSAAYEAALRALGVSRNETSLEDEAAASFEAMGLAWRVAETRDLSVRH
jgi:hypothetical protein